MRRAVAFLQRFALPELAACCFSVSYSYYAAQPSTVVETDRLASMTPKPQ